MMLISVDFRPDGVWPIHAQTPAALFHPAGARWLRGELRHYYYNAGARRIILVLRHGLRLTDLATGDVLDASLGYEDGRVGYVRPGDEGLRHTKITMYRRLAEASAEFAVPLSQIVTQAPPRLLP